MNERRISRRDLITKTGKAAVAGIVGAELMIPIAISVGSAVEKITHAETGNASYRKKLEDRCRTIEQTSPNDVVKCADEFTNFSAIDYGNACIIAPLLEEGVFRQFPSFVLNTEDQINNQNSRSDNLGLSRRELIAGVASSLVFGAVHNITGDGVDIKTIPAHQATVGMGFWYLQRKIGFLSNTISHSYLNLRALSGYPFPRK